MLGGLDTYSSETVSTYCFMSPLLSPSWMPSIDSYQSLTMTNMQLLLLGPAVRYQSPELKICVIECWWSKAGGDLFSPTQVCSTLLEPNDIVGALTTLSTLSMKQPLHTTQTDPRKFGISANATGLVDCNATFSPHFLLNLYVTWR